MPINSRPRDHLPERLPVFVADLAEVVVCENSADVYAALR